MTRRISVWIGAAAIPIGLVVVAPQAQAAPSADSLVDNGQPSSELDRRAERRKARKAKREKVKAEDRRGARGDQRDAEEDERKENDRRAGRRSDGDD